MAAPPRTSIRKPGIYESAYPSIREVGAQVLQMAGIAIYKRTGSRKDIDSRAVCRGRGRLSTSLRALFTKIADAVELRLM